MYRRVLLLELAKNQCTRLFPSAKMRDTLVKTTPLLPQQIATPLSKDSGRNGQSTWTHARRLVGCALVVAWMLYSLRTWNYSQSNVDSFYASITNPKNICPATAGPAISHSGHIGLRGDSEDAPKRLFFWYFEAEHDAENAPTILTVGGGPGSSGLMNPMLAQGPCLIAENGTISNPNRWTEHFNLIALDHPVGAGFSYGTLVNNSRSAAIDVYDFLQKFYRLFPHLAKNQFILSGGSYGGMYIPHIATVIHEQNTALAAGKGQTGAVHINLESMMVSNPVSDATSYYGWMLQTRCYNVPDMYNASTCAELFELLPTCLDSIRLAQQGPEWKAERHAAAHKTCLRIQDGDRHGTVIEDVRKKCYDTGPKACLPPSFGRADAFFNQATIKDALGIPERVNFAVLNEAVIDEFEKYGDKIQAAHLLYEPLLAAGIRLMHYVGAQDANCAWPGVLSFLRLIRSPFQEEFLRTADVPWPTAEDATVRVVGEGAGNMTYILVHQGGHFVAGDQPKLVKSIVDHWVQNVPFVSSSN
ncbi:alpha/beta-hydrolase [Mycena maculata]|uniref:carboxypeptidase C n=1 Tax=Mycena maculata TaxID=230809 RepID=A0AAD7K4C5_9AGAR|nr:alpha/beta-hydrolase [Mycena maculata]